MPSEQENSSASQVDSATPPSSVRSLFALFCAIAGCLAWLGALFLMGNYDDAEQLARFFQALVNVVILVVFGGVGLIAPMVGLVLCRGNINRHRPPIDRACLVLCVLALVAGLLILATSLPLALARLQNQGS